MDGSETNLPNINQQTQVPVYRKPYSQAEAPDNENVDENAIGKYPPNYPTEDNFRNQARVEDFGNHRSAVAGGKKPSDHLMMTGIVLMVVSVAAGVVYYLFFI